MWSFARAQHPHVAAHVSLLLRVITAIFCKRDTFTRCVSANGILVRASDAGLPRMLHEADEQVLSQLRLMLQNPFLKVSLPVGFWRVGMLIIHIDSITIVHYTVTACMKTYGFCIFFFDCLLLFNICMYS